jgi:transposase
LLASSPDIPDGLRALLRLCRETVVRLGKTESALVRSLEQDSLLMDRVERLMTIPAVGPITALSWALLCAAQPAVADCFLDKDLTWNALLVTWVP